MEYCKTPRTKFIQIPKIIHIIWVGDESKCPHHWIQTWRDNHPDWEVRLWGNRELDQREWKSKTQINVFRSAGHWEGVADLMRYEILYEYGGIYVDADSASARPLDDWLLDTRMFAIWENENHRPGLVANGFIGSIPGHPALDAIIQKTSIMNEQVWRRNYKKISWKGMRPHIPYEPTEPWITVGPVLFTKTIMPFCPLDVTILPSILFLPKHYLDKEERKTNWTYATHEWGNTFKTY